MLFFPTQVSSDEEFIQKMLETARFYSASCNYLLRTVSCAYLQIFANIDCEELVNRSTNETGSVKGWAAHTVNITNQVENTAELTKNGNEPATTNWTKRFKDWTNPLREWWASIRVTWPSQWIGSLPEQPNYSPPSYRGQYYTYSSPNTVQYGQYPNRNTYGSASTTKRYRGP